MQSPKPLFAARILALGTALVLGAAQALTPTDPGLSYMDLYLGSQPGGINAYAGWDYHFQGQPVTVAVIDSGYLPHPEFENRVLPGYDLANQGTAQYQFLTGPDGKSYRYYVMSGNVPVAGGLDTDFQSSLSSDKIWHGTKVAGVILAASNQTGITGLNPSARLLPIRVAKAGDFAPNTAAQAIRWAVGLPVTVNGVALPINPNPARILNLSLGGDDAVPNRSGEIGCSDEYQDAIDAANQTGAVVVVAAGNYFDQDVKEYMPANCKGVVVVGGSNPYTGDRATDISSFGQGVTLSAPTAGIHSTTAFKPASGATQYLATYEAAIGSLERGGLRGTSFAAPLVSGALALMFSYRPQLGAAEAVEILKTTARPFPSGSSCATLGCGTGVLNLGAAMALLNQRYPAAPTCGLSATSTTVATGASTTLTVAGTGLPSGARAYWYGTKNGAQDASGSESIAAPGSSSLVNSAGMQGTYVRYAQIRNAQGQTICTTGNVTLTYQAPVVSCSLAASKTNVSSGDSMVFTISGNYLPTGARGYWYGTKNGIQDANGAESIPAPGSNTYVNSAGMQGIYVRYAQIRDAQGNTVCTTNNATVTYQAPVPTCSLSGPSVVARNASYSYTVSGSNLPSGAVGYWSGTKNGVTDASNQYAGGVPSSFGFSNGGWVGNYVRWMNIYSPSGSLVCTTNAISTTLQ
ncbi:S8 family serine peptidase [Chitiniphilus eburneus]|uniref:Peptidase S8/S53 domain-containing protein n=1 Tax=Chitiniphilus eburneus TaxID=2571148 RepID=A0A4U0Q398_9NEIS|nr:S8 family serine peptidase [Chitiniphilus eburneus]TJZ75561.1 hypothetical protein FAZ21_06495 [Chitiniphilus eburneus]